MPGPFNAVTSNSPHKPSNPRGVVPGPSVYDTVNTVADAIRDGRVLLAFQPVMQARDTNKVAFHEGLIRVMDPEGRVIPARHFISAIEDTPLGRALDTLALQLGLQALHENADLRLSINMSAKTIGYAPWDAAIDEWRARDPLIGERLIVEITETSAMTNPKRTLNFMSRLQAFGICFAMDDFGAGVTSLRFFRDFRFDMIKIDGQFIRGIATDTDNQAIVSAIVSIARQFDMLIVAEVVETQADATMLVTLGIDCLQGHHFSAPTTRPSWLRLATPQTAN